MIRLSMNFKKKSRRIKKKFKLTSPFPGRTSKQRNSRSTPAKQGVSLNCSRKSSTGITGLKITYIRTMAISFGVASL